MSRDPVDTVPELGRPPRPDARTDDPEPASPRRDDPVSRGWAATVATVAGRVVQGMAAWQVVALLLLPFAPGVVRRVAEALSVLNLPAQPGFFSLVLLATVASGLVRRLRVTLWVLVLVWQAPVVLAGLVTAVLWAADPAGRGEPGVTARDVVAWVVAVVAVPVLVSARSAFPARVRPGAWWRSLLVAFGGVAAGTLLSFALLRVLGRGLPTVGDQLQWAFAQAFSVYGSALDPGTVGYVPTWVGVVGGLVAAVGLVLALVLFMRSREPVGTDAADDRLQVRRLLLEHPSGDSLGYFATRDDRSTQFSADRRAAVSYRVVSEVCLAAGDPIGDPASWPDAVARWLATARRYGWVPAATSTTEAGARAYRAAGLHPIVMGDEAVIVTRSFDLRNPAMRGVRRAVERGRAAGYEVRVRRQAETPPDELAEVVAQADRWRQGQERGYSMALDRFGSPVDPGEVVVTARDADGRLRGVLSFVPWGRHGLSLDVMRRSPDAVSGVTELMVAGLVDASRDLGVERISMNFAMFRETFQLGERVGATPVQRLNRRVLLLASRFWQLEQLYRSNEKYLPEWQPRVLCYEAAGHLTRVVLALGQAEGFVPPLRRLAGGEQPPVAAADDPALVAAVVAQEQELLAVRAPTRRLTQQQRVRRAKVAVLRAVGTDPYPVAVPRTHTVRAARGVQVDGPEVSVVGRVVRLRDLGGVVFAVLREGTDEVQALLTASGTTGLDLFRRTVDLGDQVSVTGPLTHSRSGELSVAARTWRMATKALTPPPDKRHGLADAEARVRLRHMDLALHDAAAVALRARSTAVWSIRTSLVARGFLEVETPILQRIHGGANARPFVTHINAYDLDLYLRIAPELFLKRLMVGGTGKVFELGRSFRNEGVDATHNPEFTSMEAYEAYGDYTTMRELTRELVVAAALAVHGEPVAHRPGGGVVRLDGPWPVVTVHEAVSRAVDREVTPDLPLTELQTLCSRLDVAWEPTETHGALVSELYDRFVEGQTVVPTFYTDFPVETSPLTRAHRTDPRLAERWDLVAFGAELGTAYSELTDPVEQRRRLTEQSVLAAAGDPEAMEIDEDFLDALEFGMPPTGGVGVGVDRVVMTLVGGTIRDTLAFPFLRPRGRA
ncbi:bifunctional lysylphosphatidylglycerol synthetase/lysine--tRNA ligase LysX [Cellulomonas sp. zg-ZUI199]|uniref:Lysine--tRNA ligase n=1 Tax=Cellulomonas wangleii TaxID=2816956 RepID=A0ABX8D5J2_9CELL|nr:bifunctional lysylphosphatidylglycerol synthetase/lysine--tRNA ligase LysX [Cellulomonas wangleii]MBO0926214.1 bifunctional lysylphosphatidylglycerol synthetase/lysine--tRNA ligase LysX [Cellulomonas wangleii]QVI62723.1 bifunctional lysylphosphatidylglycerol synthetase/lysine--tRNA ligase LysX [Cellulomonas wangleii]